MRPRTSGTARLVLISLALSWAACFQDPDVSKMKCTLAKGCPEGYACVQTSEGFRCQSAGAAGQDGAAPDAPIAPPSSDAAMAETAGRDIGGRDGATAEAAIPIDSRAQDVADVPIPDAEPVAIGTGGSVGTGGASVVGGATGLGGAGSGGASGTGGAGRDAGTAGAGGATRDVGPDVPSGGGSTGGGPGTGGRPGTGGGPGTGGTPGTGGAGTGGTPGTGGAACSLAGATGASTLSIDVNGAQTLIPKELFGVLMERLGRQFTNNGLFVGTGSSIPNTNGMRNDVIDGLKEAGVGLIQFPGGCAANGYDWNANKTPTNDVGTDRFMELCQLVGAEPYITGKPRDTDAVSNAAWVDYIQGKWSLKYFKVGCEVWGACGVSLTEPVYEVNYTASHNRLTGKNLFLVASADLIGRWTWYETMVTNIGSSIDGVELNDYLFFPDDISSTDFTTAQYYDIVHRANTGQVGPHLDTLIGILDQRDPAKRIKIVVDTWGDWLMDLGDGWQQQNTVMDAISAAEHLHLFMARANRIQIAALAQAVNVMHSLLLIDNTGILAKTSTFYVFKMFIPHHSANAKLAPSTLQSETITGNSATFPVLSASASVNEQGRVHVSLVNVDPVNSRSLQITLGSSKTGYTVQSAQIVTGPAINSYNAFGQPETVNIKPLPASNYAICAKQLAVTLPVKSVVMLALDPQ
jgi:alpha-N-arabinofuranosidase